MFVLLKKGRKLGAPKSGTSILKKKKNVQVFPSANATRLLFISSISFNPAKTHLTDLCKKYYIHQNATLYYTDDNVQITGSKILVSVALVLDFAKTLPAEMD